MKTLIFSDTHFTTVFRQDVCDFWLNLIDSVDKVIINGDFWDSMACSFDDFINSSWQQLFPLLKDKQAVYIYGNHDLEHHSDQRVELFSDIQVQQYQFHLGNTQVVVEHGHRLISSLEEHRPWLCGNRLAKKIWGIDLRIVQKKSMFRFLLAPINLYNEKISSKKGLACLLNQFAEISQQDNLLHIFGHVHLQYSHHKKPIKVLGPNLRLTKLHYAVADSETGDVVMHQAKV